LAKISFKKNKKKETFFARKTFLRTLVQYLPWSSSQLVLKERQMASLQYQVCLFYYFNHVLPFSCQGQPTSDEILLEEKRQEFIHTLLKSMKAVIKHAEKEFCKRQMLWTF